MTDFPAVTIDIAQSVYRVRANTFRRVTLGEYSTGAFMPVPRTAGPRFRLWATELDTASMSHDMTQEWESVIDRLDGGAYGLKLWDPMRELPRGAAAGVWRGSTPAQYTIDGSYLIDGKWHISGGATHAYVDADAARHADVLIMSGLVASATVLTPGDLFEVGGNLYSAIDTAVSDASGVAAVRFSWKLWKPALAGDRVNFLRPTGRFVLANPNEGWANRDGMFASASLKAVEVPFFS